MQVEDDPHEHPDALLDRALQGVLGDDERAELERHMVKCPSCAAEMEAVRIFKGATAPGKHDDALNRQAVEAALSRLEQPESLGDRLRRSMKRLLRPTTLALGGAVAMGAVWLVFQMRRPQSPASLSPMPPSEVVMRPLVLEDGSEIMPLEKTAAIEVSEQTPFRTTVQLQSGGARFRVLHDSRRLFRVDAGPISVEDLGTIFRVAHEAEDTVRVTVSEGRVAVLIPVTGARLELGAGEDRAFSATSAPAPVPNPTIEATQRPVKPPAASGVSTVSRVPSRASTVDSAGELLRAADLARRSGQPQAAVAPLRTLVERHAKDPRAPSAAFTLGWVLLTDLGRAREAAAAFTEAERIAPRGALAEDAAARVAEAWQKAGDLDRAAQAARHYEQMYPTGRYTSLMHGLVREK